MFRPRQALEVRRPTPPNRPRDPAYMFISSRPAEKVRDEVSVIFGYGFKPNADASIEISGGSLCHVHPGRWRLDQERGRGNPAGRRHAQGRRTSRSRALRQRAQPAPTSIRCAACPRRSTGSARNANSGADRRAGRRSSSSRERSRGWRAAATISQVVFGRNDMLLIQMTMPIETAPAPGLIEKAPLRALCRARQAFAGRHVARRTRRAPWARSACRRPSARCACSSSGTGSMCAARPTSKR